MDIFTRLNRRVQQQLCPHEFVEVASFSLAVRGLFAKCRLLWSEMSERDGGPLVGNGHSICAIKVMARRCLVSRREQKFHFLAETTFARQGGSRKGEDVAHGHRTAHS